MRKPVKTHMFNGRRYKLRETGPIDGTTDTYNLYDRWMLIAAKPKTKDELETFIHESLHAENWAATEEVVSRVGTEIASFLWRLGYRRLDK